MNQELVALVADLKEDEALALVEKLLAGGGSANEILDSSKKAMEIVGERFASQTYFIPDLIYSGEILKKIVAVVEPQLKAAGPAEKLGKIVFGTVAGDVHDIGKNIVEFMLDANGFEVYDLGIDVPKEDFVAKVKETGATIVGLSGFLTLAFAAMKETVEALQEAGLRDQVKIMIGGGQVDEYVLRDTGADAFGTDAQSAVQLAKQWAQK